MATTFEFLFALVLIALVFFPQAQQPLVAQVFLNEDDDDELPVPEGTPETLPNPGPSGEFDDIVFD